MIWYVINGIMFLTTSQYFFLIYTSINCFWYLDLAFDLEKLCYFKFSGEYTGFFLLTFMLFILFPLLYSLRPPVKCWMEIITSDILTLYSTLGERHLVFHHLVWEDTLKKGLATHSTILAWGIPWTEEQGGLQSMG